MNYFGAIVVLITARYTDASVALSFKTNYCFIIRTYETIHMRAHTHACTHTCTHTHTHAIHLYS